VFSGFSSVPTRAAEGPGDCGLEVFVAEEVGGVGACILGGTIAKTYGLGTVYFNCQSVIISRVTASRLKEFCHI
jgi:hypothetical protein